MSLTTGRRRSPTKGRPMKSGKAASQLTSDRIAELGDRRGDTLTRMRALITEADPGIVEEWKWMGTRSGPMTGSTKRK